MDNDKLIKLACEAMMGAYAPYSRFQVGAALLTPYGKVYSGCNIENAAYGVTNCAERTAFFKAVSEGERKFSKIAVVGGINGVLSDYAAPCGPCRQVMREFCEDDFEIVLYNGSESLVCRLDELLPLGFRNENLK